MSDTKSRKAKTFWFWLSVVMNLGLLGLFKYYNFFILSFAEALSHFGLHVNNWTLQLVLPVGISFYTFHGLSYVIDIYQDKIKAERNFVDYALFVSFFPLLVAGPIERATHLLPQIKTKRNFQYSKAIDGLRQILWGLFKKIVIADQCAVYANQIFDHYGTYSGATLFLGALFFAIQIYGDFSGYSDIALGTARLFGFELLRNFAFPYFSRDIAEFWRRWHISLSGWFRDYLYIPLGGSKGGTWMKVRNTFIIFIVSGFWHGASWTFIAWGLLNAIYFLPLLLSSKNRTHLDIVARGQLLPSVKDAFKILCTLFLVIIAWIFFRSPNISDALHYIVRMVQNPISFVSIGVYLKYKSILLLICLFMALEWIGREQQYAIAGFGLNWRPIYRYVFYYSLLVSVIWFSGKEQQFIYFQF